VGPRGYRELEEVKIRGLVDVYDGARLTELFPGEHYERFGYILIGTQGTVNAERARIRKAEFWQLEPLAYEKLIGALESEHEANLAEGIQRLDQAQQLYD
jgi:hypothetical protein